MVEYYNHLARELFLKLDTKNRPFASTPLLPVDMGLHTPTFAMMIRFLLVVREEHVDLEPTCHERSGTIILEK